MSFSDQQNDARHSTREVPSNHEQHGIFSRRRVIAGVVAGSLAGLVMAMAMMVYKYSQGKSIWTNPDLIAAMWMGNTAADGELTMATLVGFLTHMATSALMGIIALPFIYGLPAWRTMLAAFAYAVASYPVVFSVFLTWLNPLMIERTELIPMTGAHILFGLVLGIGYLWLRPEAANNQTQKPTTQEFI